MTYKKVFWSLILIIIGLLLLSNNLGWIDISWSSVWYVWPVLFILWGVSVLPVKDIIKIISSTIIVIATVLAIIFVEPKSESWFSSFGNNSWKFNYNVDDDDDDDYYDDTKSTTWGVDSANIYNDNQLCQDFEGEENVELSMDMSVGKYSITSSEDDSRLLCLNRENENYSYSMTTENITSTDKKIKFTLPSGTYKIDTTLHFDFSLNTKPTWKLDINAGASNTMINGKDLKIRKIDIEEGVANTVIFLGSKSEIVDLSCESGVSKITINIPKDAYCHIENDGALNKTSLKGFTEKGKGEYVFNEGKSDVSCKIFMDLSIAISSFNIITY